MAQEDRAGLVPVVGAGCSMPLGLPSWKSLRAKLLPEADAESLGEDTRPPDFLSGCKNLLGQAEFVTRVQRLLTLRENVTSTTLQALVSAGCTGIVTLNLDHALEVAFDMAGRPLRPADVITASDHSSMMRFGHPYGLTTLLKLHGTVDRPETWVLTADDYKREYQSSDHLSQFLQTRIEIPLFIGCGFSDLDLDQALRLRDARWRYRRGYAIVPHDMVERQRELFKSLSVIPLDYYEFDDIEELIDEIFDCPPLAAHVVQTPNEGPVQCIVGGARVRVPPKPANREPLSGSVAKVLEVLTNALDFHPNQSYLERERRRKSNKNDYLNSIQELVLESSDEATEVLSSVLLGLAQYPTTLIRGAIAGVLRGAKTDSEAFVFLETLIHQVGLERPAVLEQVSNSLISQLEDPAISYPARRALTKALAGIGVHPAAAPSIATARVNDLSVARYLLTESQVYYYRFGRAKSPASCRPHVLRDLAEAAEIVDLVRRSTGEASWRMPSTDEWQMIAGVHGEVIEPGDRWPWGNQEPTYHEHAHLTFAAEHRSSARHPLEVGLFPAGRSADGVLDLIGNVHELTETGHRRYLLAGGAWSSKYSPGRPFQLLRGMRRYQPNTGIRLVVD